jgi:acyl-CoA reductase-like NAD-dependent aldehyde dehydrogenase
VTGERIDQRERIEEVMTYKFPMTIAGAPVTTDRTLDVEDPATQQVIGVAPVCSPEQLDLAMGAAAEAMTSWQADEDQRRGAMRAAAQALREHAGELGAILTAEQGKPLMEAVGEAYGCALWLDYFAGLEVPEQVIQDDDRARVVVRRRPVGVVAAIAPWNVPLALAFWKVAPALRAGNTVVLKPSPYTPLSTLRVGEILGSVLPPGVLNVITGENELGELMTNHPVPRKVSFTGSVPVGKKVAVAAAQDLKRVTLELGGNDAAVLLDDVDVDAIAESLFTSAFSNAGQICCAVKRIYVPQRLHDRLADALADLARSIRIGDGTDPETKLGPVAHDPQLQRVDGLVRAAVAAGGRVLAGGRRLDRPGYFYAPAIVTDVDESVELVREEQFGPALPLIAYTDEDQAIAAVNSTPYGLGGSVWSAAPDRADAVGARLECGTVWINTHKALAVHQPFGGWKWSGLGVENGMWGLDTYTDIQVHYTAR